MWKIILELSLILLVLIIATQVLFPLIMDKPLFWLFRPRMDFSKPKEEKRSFDEEIEFVSKEKSKAEEARLKIEDDIKEKINKVNNLNN